MAVLMFIIIGARLKTGASMGKQVVVFHITPLSENGSFPYARDTLIAESAPGFRCDLVFVHRETGTFHYHPMAGWAPGIGMVVPWNIPDIDIFHSFGQGNILCVQKGLYRSGSKPL